LTSLDLYPRKYDPTNFGHKELFGILKNFKKLVHLGMREGEKGRRGEGEEGRRRGKEKRESENEENKTGEGNEGRRKEGRKKEERRKEEEGR
jgi:hypothetical protein